MSYELAKAKDVVSGGLQAQTGAAESGRAIGFFTAECHDKDGNLKWKAEAQNLVVATGLQYMAGTALDGATSRITVWYLGLYGAASSNTPAYNDTMSSHAGWTEVTDYSGNRPTATFAAATTPGSGGAPSVVTNTASKATFNITGTATVGGAFLTSDNTVGGTTGTLFSAADFQSPGDRSVVNGDTLTVTYTFNLNP